MTIGTAMEASTKVRTTVVNVRSQSPRTRLRTVRVGKTAIQIISASWCLVGGPAVPDDELAVGRGWPEGVFMLSPSGGRSWRVGRAGRGRVRARRCVRLLRRGRH